MDKLNINDKVWVLANNRAVEVTISKITKFQSLKKGENGEKDQTLTTIQAFASYNDNVNHEHELIDGLYFDSKQDLINSL
jgi:hypothetical protein